MISRIWFSRLLISLFISILGLGVTAVVLAAIISVQRPSTGNVENTQKVLKALYTAINIEKWRQTGAVRWVFSGRHTHTWDRNRGLVKVVWKDIEALLIIRDQSGRVWQKGEEVFGSKKANLLKEAWKLFVNDSFWLQPFDSLENPGVTTSVLNWGGQDALFFEFSSGGVTPGDAYLVLLDEQGLPHTWHMWVQVLPIGGLEASWEDWVPLKTGAKVSTRHKLGPITFRLTEVLGAADINQLEPDSDPFAPLFGKR